MPQSVYIETGDYASFGLAASTPAATVAQASALVDAYLRRPQGLLYVSDSTGQPCYMAALSPSLTLKSVAGFGPGIGIVVPAIGALSMLQVGDCVVLDRANPELVEAIQVAAVDVAAGTLTFGNAAANGGYGVQFAHGAECTIELGLLIEEQRNLPKNRSKVMLASTPIARIVGGAGRYAYGRRGDAAMYNMDSFNLLASLSQFGGPPAWEMWPANAAGGINAPTGELWVPAGIMLAYYSEVKVRYVAGFTYASLPPVIQFATASLVNAISTSAGIGTLKKYGAGDTNIERFTESLLDPDMQLALGPYRARAFA